MKKNRGKTFPEWRRVLSKKFTFNQWGIAKRHIVSESELNRWYDFSVTLGEAEHAIRKRLETLAAKQ